MLTFSIISVVPNPDLDVAIQAKYENASYKVSPTVWFVADNGVTAQEVSKKIGVKDSVTEGLTGIIVVQNGTYFGHASKSIWDWLAVKTSAT